MQVFTGEYGCAVLKSHAFRGWVQHKSAQNLQGNRDNKPLNSICWNERVNCLACVSDNCAKVWSTDGQPVRELIGTAVSARAASTRGIQTRWSLGDTRYQSLPFTFYRSDHVILTEGFLCSFIGYCGDIFICLAGWCGKCAEHHTVELC